MTTDRGLAGWSHLFRRSLATVLALEPTHDMRRSLPLRHLFPVAATTAFVVAAAALITLPLAGVFLLDNSFVVTDYLKFLLLAFGVGAGLSIAVMFPLAWALEAFVAKRKALAFVPVLFVFAAAALVGVRMAATYEILNTLFGWPGLFLALSLIFGFYWVALWMVEAGKYFVRTYRQ